jgi:hypothetical protein
VHAPVEARAVAQEFEQPRQAERSSPQERIEQPHLDIRLRRQRGEIEVPADGVQVVDQQAHANAALRRAQRPLQQQRRGRIASPTM